MIYGVDSYSNVTNVLPSLKESGYSFVIRYYTSISTSGKKTSASEIAAIGNAGLKRVAVFQNSHTQYSHFSESIAANDASAAISQAKSVGQSSGIIYFAVDFDASTSQINGNIKAHFSKLGTLLSQAGYSVGVYGSSLTCKLLKDSNLVNATWLAMPSDWGFGTVFSDWNIHQTKEITIGSSAFDENEANSLAGIGAW